MDIKEFKGKFLSDLDNGLDHAEWYEKEIKCLIEQAEKVEKLEQDIIVLKEDRGMLERELLERATEDVLEIIKNK